MSSNHRSSGRRLAVVVGGAVAGILLSGTAAVAYWTATGTGSGTAQSTTMVAPTISAGTTSGTALYPGLTANGTATGADLAVTATNPNPFPITVTLTQAGSTTGCTTPAVTFSGGSISLPANASAVTATVAKSVSMGASASNDCQGKTLTIPLTTSASSS